MIHIEAKKNSLPVCLKSVDTGDKGGTINQVMNLMNPQGC